MELRYRIMSKDMNIINLKLIVMSNYVEENYGLNKFKNHNYYLNFLYQCQ